MSRRTMTAFLVDQGVLQQEPFTLFDVGCSGGLQRQWRVFGNDLVGHAFDPMVGECEALRRKEKNSRVQYINAFVGLDPGHPFAAKRKLQRNNDDYIRTSGYAGTMILDSKLSLGRKKTLLNAWEQQALTPDAPITLDDYAKSHAITDIDFIKVDVDGSDIEVLHSAKESLATRGVLGLQVEVWFGGGASETENTFHNIDRLMRGAGFDLYALQTWNYSRPALPSPYLYDAPWQTVTGKIFSGDAVYFRDWCGEQPDLPATVSPAKILKLACCYELYQQHDSAAELLVRYRDRLSSVVDVDGLLNRITRSSGLYGRRSYRDVVDSFNTDPTSFFHTDFIFAAQHEVLLGHLQSWVKKHGPGKSCIVFGANELGARLADNAKRMGLHFVGYADNFVKKFKRKKVLSSTELSQAKPDLVLIVSKAHAKTIRDQLLAMHPQADFDIVSMAAPS